MTSLRRSNAAEKHTRSSEPIVMKRIMTFNEQPMFKGYEEYDHMVSFDKASPINKSKYAGITASQ